MKQYIDKSALVAKIEKRYECWREKEFNAHTLESEIRMSECQHLMLLLNTLEVKEVNLDKEVDNVMARFLGHLTCREEELKFAKHFFELGLNVAQKGE